MDACTKFTVTNHPTVVETFQSEPKCLTYWQTVQHCHPQMLFIDSVRTAKKCHFQICKTVPQCSVPQHDLQGAVLLEISHVVNEPTQPNLHPRTWGDCSKSHLSPLFLCIHSLVLFLCQSGRKFSKYPRQSLHYLITHSAGGQRALWVWLFFHQRGLPQCLGPTQARTRGKICPRLWEQVNCV